MTGQRKTNVCICACAALVAREDVHLIVHGDGLLLHTRTCGRQLPHNLAIVLIARKPALTGENVPEQ